MESWPEMSYPIFNQCFTSISPENQRFSDVIRGCRSRTFVENGLIKNRKDGEGTMLTNITNFKIFPQNKSESFLARSLNFTYLRTRLTFM